MKGCCCCAPVKKAGAKKPKRPLKRKVNKKLPRVLRGNFVVSEIKNYNYEF
jgi:hypothetical protein